MSVASAMVRFKNTARSKEAKTIMTAANLPEGTFAPVFRPALERGLWFAQNKFNRFTGGARLKYEGALGTIVRKGVAKKFEERLLQEMRIDLEGLFA